MTLKEKLANSYNRNRKEYDEYYENGYCQDNYEDIRKAFIAGFEAAKREAVKKLTRVYNDDVAAQIVFYIGEED